MEPGKFLMELKDKEKIETVVIPHSNDKNTKYSPVYFYPCGLSYRMQFCATEQRVDFKEIFTFLMKSWDKFWARPGGND